MPDFCFWGPTWVNMYYENVYTYATPFFLKVEARVRFVRGM